MPTAEVIMEDDVFVSDIARHIWDTRYRYRAGDRVMDATVADTWRRVAKALAAVEPRERDVWERRFFEAMRGFTFLPGGRILAGAGTHRRVTLFNCFVMGVIEDSMDGIFESLKEGALTMQQGGGIGYDFSTLRPAGVRARATGAIASGPVSFMHVWDAMCATVLSTGARRGAMMATLRCDHPDVEAFIDAKRAPGALRHFNLSVLVTDAFMEAVRRDEEWPLVFPVSALDEDEGAGREIVHRRWSGTDGPVPCVVLGRLRARALWAKLMRSAYDHAEPGVLFIDRVNAENNLWYREYISASNPCGEIPLPPYGACDLGALNLTRFVEAPFTPEARLDLEALARTAAVAVRMLDDVIDASRFPLDKQAAQARGSRRIGLGLTGLADALIMLGLTYGTPEARTLATEAMRTICHTAYRASIELAREKGPFPFFERDKYLNGAFIARLPKDIREGIAEHGIRNSHLLAIAPTGTISLLANNVSSGVEPVFDFVYTRRVLDEEGHYVVYEVADYAYRLWRARKGATTPLPPYFVTAQDLPPLAHLEMQAALQPFVDNAISKTVNVPEETPFREFTALYETAYAKGVKGFTTFRPNPVTGAVMEAHAAEGAQAPHCCSIEREAD
ncbi:adenosylcobalamin-dependent ribonucleoside-diphosphate reductase [Rhodocaloribacter sp.]